MTVTFIAGQELPEMRTATIAKALRCSPGTVEKLLTSELLPDRTPLSVESIARRRVITSLTTNDGRPVPVLRLGVSSEDIDGRPTGYSPFYSPAVLHAAADRWWKPTGRDLVLAAGAYAVVMGTVVVAWMDVEGIKETDDETGRLWYDTTMVAYLEDGQATQLESSSNETLAMSVVGERILGGGGGTFTTIQGDS